jgi:hypothetical protein
MAQEMLGDSAAGSVLLKPGQALKLNADGSTSPEPPLSMEEQILAFVELHQSVLMFNDQSYRLLQYASAAALEEDAARAGLTPAVFFNVVCLLRARKLAAVSLDALRGLETYVSKTVADLKVAEIALTLQ